MRMLRPVLMCLIAALAIPSASQTTLITFDVDALGNPISAPTYFMSTGPLTTEYASLGVTFGGSGPGLGGAILNDSSWLYKARSGENILAFNDTVDPPHDYPALPERLVFSTPMSDVEIWFSGSKDVDEIVIQAYNSSDMLVDSMTLASQDWALLSVHSDLGISKVYLHRLSGTEGTEFDDLKFTVLDARVPEPGAAALLLAALPAAALVVRRRR